MDNKKCLPESELAEFVRCSLDEASSEKIAAHLVHCPVCEETVASLEKTITERWKRAESEQEENRFIEEPECRKLMEAVSSPEFMMKGEAAEIVSGSLLTELREYKDLEQIGQGGMGTVYRARHSRLDRIVALKALPSNKVLDPQAVARFDREMKAVGKLDHPNIVRAMDAGEHNGQHYLVMEYVDGIDVGKLAGKVRQLPIADACEIVRQAAIGLQHAHEHGLVHRDIKPGNLMLTKSGQVKILDLGLALLGGPNEVAHTELTSHGQVMGTLDYMAPEQGGDTHGVDIRADIYALGATLFRLLTGSAPFNGDKNYSVMQKLTALATQAAPDVREKRPDVNKKLAELVARLLEKDPARRLQTPAELVEALAAFSDGAELPTLAAGVTGGKVAEPTTPLAGKQGTAKKSVKGVRKADKSTQPKGTLPPRLRRFVMLSGGAAFVLFAVVMLFKLPNGGELAIECDDPNAQITFSVVKDGESKPLSISLEEGNHLRLSEGVWIASISGVDSDGFRLEADRIEMTRGGTPTVRIRRLSQPAGSVDQQVTATTDPDSKEPAQPDVKPMMPMESAEEAVAPLFPELGQQEPALASIDWTKVGISSQTGLLPTWLPVQEGSDLSWQIRPWLETVGPHIGDPQAMLADLDPTGKYLGVVTEADAKVIELETGRVTHSIPAPTNSRWHTIRLSADADRVVLSDSINFEVRDRRNRIVSLWLYHETEWFQKSGAYYTVHTLASWCVPGESLLLFSDQKAFLTDIYGNLIQEVSIPEGFRLSQRSRMSVSPDSKTVILTCNEFRLLRWDLTKNTIEEFGKSITEVFNKDLMAMVRWSPDGQLIACSGYGQNGIRTAIATPSGDILHEITSYDLDSEVARQRNLQHPMAFAWSPDSKSLAFDSGRLINIDGSVIRDLDVSVVDKIGEQEFSGSRAGTYPSWTTIGRIDFVNVGLYGPISTGHVESFSPTGKKLATHKYGNLLRPQGAMRSKKVEQLHLAYHQGRSHVTPQRITTLSGEGVVESAVPIHSPAVGDPRQVISRWDGRKWERNLPVIVRDKAGTVIGEYQPPEGWIHGGVGSFAHTSGKLALSLYNDTTCRIVLLDEEMREVAIFERSVIERISGSPVIRWSPDDRYIACAWMQRENAYLGVWEINAPETPVIVQEIPYCSENKWLMELAWSPDSKQLAAVHQGCSEQKIAIFRPETRTTAAIPCKVEGYWVNEFAWMNATKLLLNNKQFEIPLDAGIERVVPTDLFPTIDANETVCAVNGEDLFVLARHSTGNTVANFWRDGRRQGEVAIPPVTLPYDFSGSKLVLLSGVNRAYPVGVVQLDVERQAIDHLLFLTDDGRMIKLSAEGKLLNDISDWDHYLSYVVRYSSGVEVYLTGEEFQRRQSTSPEQAAIDWVIDAGGAIRLADSQDWLDPRAAHQIKFSASDVTGVDLARCLIDNQSLGRLVHFSNLQTLVLRGSSLKSLDGLPELPSLTQLDLSHLAVTDFSMLIRCPQLKDLRLGQTEVNSSSAAVLTRLKNLETIDLSGTAVDRFFLLEWRPENPKAIRVIDTPLSRETEIQTLRERWLPAHIEN